MSSDLGSRNRFSKRVKIAAFKSNDSRDSKRTPRRPRDQGENGGSRDRTEDRKRMQRRPCDNGENDRNREEMTDWNRTPRRSRDHGENSSSREGSDDRKRMQRRPRDNGEDDRNREEMTDRNRTPRRSRDHGENSGSREGSDDRKRMQRRPRDNGEDDRNRDKMTDRNRTPRRSRDHGGNGGAEGTDGRKRNPQRYRDQDENDDISEGTDGKKRTPCRSRDQGESDGTRKTMEDWQREARAFISNKTGKRVYPARGSSEGFEKKKAWSGKGHSQVNDGEAVARKRRSVSSRTMWVSDISEDKPSSRNKKTRSECLDSGENQQPDEASSIERKAREKRQKRLREDHEGPGEKLMKSKRVIRIDRCDLSNKRLDDGISIPNIAPKLKKENDDSEEKNEISKNAQFRAIQPSPSILAYVEDNLLGRRRLDELRRAGYNIELTTPLDNIPNSTALERERIEESVFRNKFDFFASAKVSSSFPPPKLPEIAFAGRSNVGKSSLLNALTRQWGVVRTSDKPGHTQTINFFDLGSKLCMVDLPGYGFAYAKEEVKEAWEELVKEYVSTRVGLKRVCLLIDTKWGMKPRDHELIQLMERAQTQYQIVLTKTDTVFPIDVARRAMQIEEALKANKSVVQPAVMVSSKSGAGIRSLRTALAKIARFAKL